eukprot:gene1486-2802_t
MGATAQTCTMLASTAVVIMWPRARGSALQSAPIVPHVNQCEFHPRLQWKALRAYCGSKNIQAADIVHTVWSARDLAPTTGRTCSPGSNSEHARPFHKLITADHFMGYMPFGGDGGPLLDDPAVLAAAAAASKASAGRKIMAAQLLVNFVLQCGAVAIPRSKSSLRQASNADAQFEAGDAVQIMLNAMDMDEHFDWDPTSVK